LLSSPESELSKSLAFLGLDVDAMAKSGTLEFPKKNVARVSRLPKVSNYIHRTKLLTYDQKSKVLKKFLKTGDIPPMDRADREFLAALFADEGQKVQDFTGVTVDWKF
jgi:hypothetical protein